MKTTSSLLLAFVVLIFASGICRSQTITTGTLSVKALCAGDSISVPFTVTGSFQPTNIFTVQLSDPDGSFQSAFQSIGSVSKTTSGLVMAGVPQKIAGGSHYRLRVISSQPQMAGSDNGTDLAVGAKPVPGFQVNRHRVLEGDSVTFENFTTGAVSYVWNFGEGASVISSTSFTPPSVFYSTPGAKTISLTATSATGCSSTYSVSGDQFGSQSTVIVYSCTATIPHDAGIDSVTKDFGTGNGDIWVQSGVTFISETGEFVVYAEPGSSVSLPGTGMLTVYLKAGASYTGGATGSHVIIYEPGAGLNKINHETLLKCSSLAFDYAAAPSNPFISFPLAVANGQTIATNPLSNTAYCAGDSITVAYTAGGSFAAKNSFTVQLSDSNGSFMTSFQNIGSLTHTTGSGSIVAGIPTDLSGGSHYRIRVISSQPYIAGSDNGTDLSIGGKPHPNFSVMRHRVLTGDSVFFVNNTSDAAFYLWNFGDGASVISSTSATPPVVFYSTAGAKTVSLTATSASGCTATYTVQGDDFGSDYTVTVYSCNPPIPPDAEVDSVTRDFGTGRGDIWVQPGVTFISETGQFVVYAEPGSSVSLPSTGMLTVYLKAGSSYTGGVTGGHILIYEPGAGLNKLNHETLLECSSLSFDYSNAPPNRFRTEAVPGSKAPAAISVFPNPASNMLYVQSSDAPEEVTLSNELGRQVLHAKGNLTSKLQLNIAGYPAGTYYLQLNFKDHSENQKVLISR